MLQYVKAEGMVVTYRCCRDHMCAHGLADHFAATHIGELLRLSLSISIFAMNWRNQSSLSTQDAWLVQLAIRHRTIELLDE